MCKYARFRNLKTICCIFSLLNYDMTCIENQSGNSVFYKPSKYKFKYRQNFENRKIVCEHSICQNSKLLAPVVSFAELV